MGTRPVFKEKLVLPRVMFGEDVYEVYEGESKNQALDFLSTKAVTRQQHYIVVETPDGVFGMDRTGIYEPSRNWRG